MIIKTLSLPKICKIMKHKRLILGILLATLLTSLMSYNSLEYDNKEPDFNYILENFEKYNNTRIYIIGQIREINETSQTLIVGVQEPPFHPIEIDTKDIKENLQRKDVIGIFGVLDGKNHVIVEKIFIHEQWKDDLIYIRSIPAIPFALYLFLRTWRFNRRKLIFERRGRDA
jgi:hypothetical protein